MALVTLYLNTTFKLCYVVLDSETMPTPVMMDFKIKHNFRLTVFQIFDEIQA